MNRQRDTTYCSVVVVGKAEVRDNEGGEERAEFNRAETTGDVCDDGKAAAAVAMRKRDGQTMQRS